jgi:pescadillo protein
MKKHKRFLIRKEKNRADMHKDRMPVYNLNHIIKERYPTFLDAVRDLDDALCLINLYANLPQH